MTNKEIREIEALVNGIREKKEEEMKAETAEMRRLIRLCQKMQGLLPGIGGLTPPTSYIITRRLSFDSLDGEQAECETLRDSLTIREWRSQFLEAIASDEVHGRLIGLLNYHEEYRLLLPIPEEGVEE